MPPGINHSLPILHTTCFNGHTYGVKIAQPTLLLHSTDILQGHSEGSTSLLKRNLARPERDDYGISQRYSTLLVGFPKALFHFVDWLNLTAILDLLVGFPKALFHFVDLLENIEI